MLLRGPFYVIWSHFLLANFLGISAGSSQDVAKFHAQEKICSETRKRTFDRFGVEMGLLMMLLTLNLSHLGFSCLSNNTSVNKLIEIG